MTVVSKVRNYEEENEILEMGADKVVISPGKMDEGTSKNAAQEKYKSQGESWSSANFPPCRSYQFNPEEL